MNRSTLRRLLPSARTVCITALTLLAMSAGAASASADGKHATERLVVRGDALVKDAPCPGGLCLELAGGAFRGTTGSGAYTGSMQLRLADAFPNGEGGVCAPVSGQVVLGAGSPNRLVLTVAGDSCQDGAGNPTTTSFTGLARFVVQYGTGTYARASGSGVAVFAEDVADHDRMTLIGRLRR